MKFEDISAITAEVASHYQYHKPPKLLVDLQDLATRILRWLVDLLMRLRFPLFGGAEHDAVSTALQLALYAAGGAAAVVVFLAVWARLRRGGGGPAVRGASDLEVSLTAADWRQQASRLSAEHDWKNACRAVYLSLLRLLDERGVAAFTPARSNYEYWYALSGRPPVDDYFRQMASRVEELWFGERRAGPEDLRFCLERLQAVEEALKPEE